MLKFVGRWIFRMFRSARVYWIVKDNSKKICNIGKRNADVDSFNIHLTITNLEQVLSRVLVFSAPEPKAQVHYCDHALSVVRRPSSVRPSSLTFHIFDFSSETTEQNLTKLYRKVDLNVLYQVCVFRADRKNMMAALASDWLRHFRLLLWNRWTEFNETWQEARSQRPLPSLCFSGRSEKQDGRPGLWLAETFSTSPLKRLNGIQRNSTRSKISTSSTMFVFFGPIWKTRWPPWPLIGWDISDFSSETAEQNSTKLDRKQDLNVLYQVCVFRADRKNKMAVLASDWLRHFRLLLWNHWTEFNKTLQKTRSQRPLPSLCFSGRSEKKMAALASDWLRHFRFLLWNRWTEFNETWQKTRSQRPLPSLCFSGRSEKLRWPPWPLIGWGIFDFSSETTERNSMKLDRKQDLNVLYQVCVFRADRKNKMAALPSDWLRHFRLLLWNRWTEFNETWQEARSQGPLPSLCFSGRSEKQEGHPGLWLAETFSTSPLKPPKGIQRNLTGSKISTSSTKFVFFGPIGKTRRPPWPLIGWDIFDFSPETAERNSTKLERKQDLNVFYQVCVFRADWKNKMAALANLPKRWHIVLRCTICGPLGLLYSYDMIVLSYTVCQLSSLSNGLIIRCQLSMRRLMVRISPEMYYLNFWIFRSFFIPHSLARPIQMKSSVKFIQSNRCNKHRERCN